MGYPFWIDTDEKVMLRVVAEHDIPVSSDSGQSLLIRRSYFDPPFVRLTAP